MRKGDGGKGGLGGGRDKEEKGGNGRIKMGRGKGRNLYHSTKNQSLFDN